MKRLLLLSLTLFGLHNSILAQDTPGWSVPVHDVKYLDEQGRATNRKIDRGFQYADLYQKDQVVRFFFNKNRANISQARIVNQDKNELIGRGKGSFFFGSAKIVFADGTVYKLRRSRNPNGYDILGPNGLLFKVENLGIASVSPITEKDFLMQTFFVFDRIRATQLPPADITHIYYPTSFNNQ
jgi:hypothetical protein